MPEILKSLLKVLASLRLTVVLLALSIVLVFWATLDQVHLGVWAVQQKFFHSFVVAADLGGLRVPVYPGGYLIGGLLLANLVAAHATRFRAGWRKSGIWIAHAGLILLLLGELASGLLQRDYQMRLEEGDTRNYSESTRRIELAVIDATDPAFDQVVAIPESLLAAGAVIQNPRLPFRVVPRLYFPNSDLQLRSSVPGAPPSPATQGVGPSLVATPLDVTYKEDERNLPTAFVDLVGPDGPIGTWLVSAVPLAPQAFGYAGRTWKLVMRRERAYEPFSLTLEKFSHDVYPGTDIPKNFSSRILLHPPEGGPGREVLIYMNNPLRYGGLTFYQASYDPNDEHATVLQVVRNPSWIVPYVSCAAIALGLVIQFLIHLAGFARRRRGP
jgi:hypothetical protein